MGLVKAYEFPATVTAAGSVELPDTVVKLLSANQAVRIILLVPDPPLYDTDLTLEEEDEMWHRYNSNQLLKQYSEADAAYDQF